MSGSFAGSAAAGGGFTQSLGTSGWSKQPNGLILQWVNFSTPSQVFSINTVFTFDVTFPITFNTVYTASGSSLQSATPTYAGTAGYTVNFSTITNSKVSVSLLSSISSFSGIMVFSVFATGI